MPIPLTKTHLIDRLNAAANGCNACGLNTGQWLTVPGVGEEDPDLFICLEAPAEVESSRAHHPGKTYGVPAIGPAGSALQDAMYDLGFGEFKLHVTNTLLHKTPNNRPPSSLEKAHCSKFLRTRLLITRPKVILALGKHASEVLRNIGGAPPLDISESHRGKHFNSVVTADGLPPLLSRVFSTYHPSYALLRNPNAKEPFIEDLKEVLAYLKGNN